MTSVASNPVDSKNAPPASGRAAEQAARDLAEAAREIEWNPSFVKELFEGKLDLRLIHPYPEPKAEDVAQAKPFLDALEKFLLEHVDGDAIDRDGKVPPEVVLGLQQLGAFGIKIPTEYGGKGLSRSAATSPLCFRPVNRSASRYHSSCSARRSRRGNTSRNWPRGQSRRLR